MKMYVVVRIMEDARPVEVCPKTNNFNRAADDLQYFQKLYPQNTYIVLEQRLDADDFKITKLQDLPKSGSRFG